MSSKEILNPQKIPKSSPTSSELDEAQVRINSENLSDEENLSEFDYDSEYESGQNGENFKKISSFL